MTMHLCKPMFNNIGNTRKKPTAKQIRAQAEHDKYLRSQGLHPEQLAARPKPAARKLNKSITVDKTSAPCSNGFAPGGAKKSVFDSEWQRTYEDDPEMAEREKIALAQAEALKGQLMPLYNKGPVQLNTGLKMTELGRRR